MHCTNCGVELAQDAKFCRRCGTAVQEDVPASVSTAEADAPTEIADGDGWPGTTDAAATHELHATAAPAARVEFATPPPPQEQPAPTAVIVSPPPTPPTAPSVPAAVAANGRPGWLIPLIAVIVALAVAGAVAAVYFATRNASPSFAAQAQTAMSPVTAADQTLSSRLAAVQTKANLAAVSSAAVADVAAITSAEGAVGLLATGKNAAAGALLKTALSADLAYANTAKKAADGLTAGLASATQTAGQQAGQAYQSAATATPALVLPQPSIYLPAQQLTTLADQQQKAAQAKQDARQQNQAATNVIRAYVRSVDSLLRNSADTRSNLGTLIGEVQDNQIGYAQASSEVSSIVNQRQDLQNQASGVQPPAPFAAAAASLRQSLTAALQDDYAIQSWINAWYQNDQFAFDNAYSQHEQATAAASSAKASFLDLYNRLRSRYLHLPPLNVAY